MSTVFALIIATYISQLCVSQNTCIWNAYNSSFVNGLYLDLNISKSGYPSYSLIIADSCNVGNRLYLFESVSSVWTISSTYDDEGTTDLIGRCDSNPAETPSDCDNLWEIPLGHKQESVFALTSIDQCPFVSCDALSLYFEGKFVADDKCVGEFQNAVSEYTNVFQKGTSDIYLYFNPSLFRWVCSNSTGIPNQCFDLNLDNYYGYAIEQSWYDADVLNLNGKSIKIPWIHGGNATISCTLSTESIPDNVCIWNAVNSSFINGLYTNDGISQTGIDIYSLQVADSCNVAGNSLYLFDAIHSVWTISSIPDDEATSDLIGRCYSNTAETPSDCDALWEIPSGTKQSNVISLASGCPSVSCDGLTLYYEEIVFVDDCVGIYEHRVNLLELTNVFQKGTSDIYLYFNPSLFRWVCGDSTGIPNQCFDLNPDKYYGYALQQSWFNADSLDSHNQSIDIAWSNGHTATISCIITPTTSAPTATTSAPTTGADASADFINIFNILLLHFLSFLY